jgi:glycosyltransferase involved in cell wall biosynthesis
MADPARREAMGAAGRARVLERFSWAAIARETMDYYGELVNGPPRT